MESFLSATNPTLCGIGGGSVTISAHRRPVTVAKSSLSPPSGRGLPDTTATAATAATATDYGRRTDPSCAALIAPAVPAAGPAAAAAAMV